MYLDHWQVPMKPFESAPDPRLYYPSAAHEDALAKIMYAAESSLAGALLWGPPGAGKTMLLDLVHARLDPERFYIVRVIPAEDSPEDLLHAVLAGMGETDLSPLKGQVLASALHARLDEWLAAVSDSNRHTVLLLDEAHILRGRESLDAVRLLMGTGSTGHRLLTTVLAGQEELGPRIEGNRLLAERIEVRAAIGRLGAEEAAHYLLRRIEAAGGRRGVFTRKGAEAVAKAGGHLPGAMNRIAESCLVTAFAAGLDRVGPDVVEAVMEDIKASTGGNR